jgi:hypothetical protein
MLTRECEFPPHLIEQSDGDHAVPASLIAPSLKKRSQEKKKEKRELKFN